MYGCRLMDVCLWGLWVKGACKIGVYVSLRVYRALRVYGIIEVWENVGSGGGFYNYQEFVRSGICGVKSGVGYVCGTI